MLGGRRNVGSSCACTEVDRRRLSFQGAHASQRRSNLAIAQLRPALEPMFGQGKSADLERAEGSTGESTCVPRASLTADPRRCWLGWCWYQAWSAAV
jgi:hypothetical protein